MKIYHNGKYIDIKHKDEEYMYSIIKGRGGASQYNMYDKESHVTMHYIGGESKIKVFYYNVILYFRWLKRKLNKIFMVR